jgi:hypothetical protein
VQNKDALNQSISADQTSGSEVTFTTTGAWISVIKETTSIPTKGGTWISINPDHGNAAGTYTVKINLEPNETGADRSTVITIICGDMDVDINITQKANASNQIQISRVICEIGNLDFDYDAQNRLSSVNFGNTIVSFTYPSVNSMIAIVEGEEWVFSLNNDGYATSISYPWDETCSFEYENGYLKRTDGCTFTWEDGNLKTEEWEGGGGTMNSYTTTPYKEANIALWMLPMYIGGDIEAYVAYFSSTLFGKSSKCLISSRNRNGEQRNYRYELNANGYVTKVFITYDKTEEYMLCEIFYK